MKSINVAEHDSIAVPIPCAIGFELAPELAVLSLLDATALIAVRALACTHPEIGTIDEAQDLPDCPPAFPSASACTASSIIAHLEALRFGITSYRRSRYRELSGIVAAPDHQQDL